MEPPIDLNTPITNPMLKEALANFTKNRSAQSQQDLLHALRAANYLVTILTDEMRTTPGDKPGHTTIEAGSKIKFMSCYNGLKERLLPAFTDWEEIRAWTKESVSTIVMSSEELWEFVLRDPKYKGLVINPSGNAWEMKSEILTRLRQQRRLTKPTPIKIGKPASPPTQEALDAIRQAISSTGATTVYWFWMSLEGDQPHLGLGVAPSEEEIVARIGRAVEPLWRKYSPHNSVCDILRLGDPALDSLIIEHGYLLYSEAQQAHETDAG